MSRALDLALCILFLVPAALVSCIVAAGIFFKLGRPIFFVQERIGRNGVPFKILKFRTMKFLYDANGALLEDKDRLTGFGSFLRASSIDEIPELLNVLRGDMSLVGPRPLLPEYLSEYTEEQKERHNVRPGITGLAQINGRNNLEWEERLTLDVWYSKHRTIFLDLKILFLTFFVVLKREGVSHKNHATMPKFRKKSK